MSRFSFTTETSLSLSTLDPISHAHSVPNLNMAITSHLSASPRSGPLPFPSRDRTHLNGTVLGSSSLRSGSEKQPSTETVHEIPYAHSYNDNDNDGNTNDQQSNPNSNPNSRPYWSSRQPKSAALVARKASKKGNVLRKKSIRRAEIVSWVGN